MAVQKAIKDIDAEIYVVDNHSDDGTVEYIGNKFPNIHLICSTTTLVSRVQTTLPYDKAKASMCCC